MEAQANAIDKSGGPELVFFGNLLVDDIVLRDGTTLMGEPGGAILHAALAARLWGTRVGLVSVAGSDYPHSTLEALADRRIDLAGVRQLGRPGGRAWLLHEADVRQVIHHLDSPTHDEISPVATDVPERYWEARAFHLAPMPIRRQLELATDFEARTQSHATPTAAFVSLDPHELVRDDNLSEWATVLANVDAFFPSEDEMRLSGDAEAKLRRAAGERLRFVALKRGIRGGQLLNLRDGITLDWKARCVRAVDMTGAGDAFVGGFLAGFIADGDAQRGIDQGIVSASFAIEDWGARGLLAATPDLARTRLNEWFGEQSVA